MKTVLKLMICIGIAAAIMSPKPLIDVTLIYNNYRKDEVGKEIK